MLGVINMAIYMIYGSTSDKEKILPGIIEFTRQYDDNVMIEYASADNTPRKVDDVLGFIVRNDADVVASGAGMSNVLTGVTKQRFSHEKLMIGVPITDSSTGGISSLLSTSEKPPGNPVLTVGLNNSYAAANIARKFGSAHFQEVKIYSGERVYDVDDSHIDKLAAELEKLKVPYDVTADIGQDDLVFNVFSFFNDYERATISQPTDLQSIDEMLNSGDGIQVGIKSKEQVKRYDQYMEAIDGLGSTGIVGIGAYKNAAIVASQLTKDGYALDMIREKELAAGGQLFLYDADNNSFREVA